MNPIGNTGIWSQEVANTGHIFSYYLAKWLSNYLSKTKSIIDLGCGKGTYLRYFHDCNFNELLIGIEGTKLNNFEYHNILVKDLSKPLKLKFKGNVLCLEVIEHIPSEFEEIIYDNICKQVDKGCKAIISCATPGQGGDGHINCRNNLHVMIQMQKRGFKCLLEDSQLARNIIEKHCEYFKETILIFERYDN